MYRKTHNVFTLMQLFLLSIFAVIHYQKSATSAVVLEIPKILLPNHMDLNSHDSIMEKHSNKAYVTFVGY